MFVNSDKVVATPFNLIVLNETVLSLFVTVTLSLDVYVYDFALFELNNNDSWIVTP